MFRPKDKNLALIMQLRKDGRQQLSAISRKTGIPVSTIFDRMRSNQMHVVKRYTCLLDFSRIGFNCRAQMVFRIRKEDRKDMQEHFLKHPNVNSAYKINNGYDFLVETVFKELREVDAFVEQLEEKFRIKEKKVYYIIDDLAREAFLTDPVHAELVSSQ